ncbi:MAG: WG repeat-containing protein, partial [Bacteroidota bacterium]
MEKKEAIEKVVKAYMSAFHTNNFDLVYSFFYEPEVIQLHELFVGLAKGLEPFGENRSLFQNLEGVKSLEELEKLAPKAFLKALMKYSVEELSDDLLQEFGESIEIMEIDEADLIAQVSYSMKNVWEKDQSRFSAELQLLNTDQGWKVLFRPGAKPFFEAKQLEIDRFNERKALDHPDRLEINPGAMGPFALYGYNDIHEHTMIEPRFRDAKEFSEGLALVRAFSLYGFIDQSGEFVIQPAFQKAESFSFGRALVANYDYKAGEYEYWFIDKQGTPLFDQRFKQANSFSENFAAVCPTDKWGFIRPDGSWLIEPQFNFAESFEDGVGYAQIHKPDGKI